MAEHLSANGVHGPKVDTDKHKLEPAFDFITSESSILLCKGQAEINIDGTTYMGEGEVRLNLLPRAAVFLYGKFQDVPLADFLMLRSNQMTISSFSINGLQVEGFTVNIGGDITTQEMTAGMTVKWCPKSEPINGVGNESTQMTRVVFHLFNFVDLIGTRRSVEQIGKERRAIEHIDLICDEWKVEIKSLFLTKDNIKTLKAEGGYRLTHIGCLEKAGRVPSSGVKMVLIRRESV